MAKSSQPLPRTWLRSPGFTGDPQDSRQQALEGRREKLTTKQGFRSSLIRHGWDSVGLDGVLSGQWVAAQKVMDLAVPKVSEDHVMNGLVAQGFDASFEETSVAKHPYAAAQWLASTQTPWWCAGGRESVILLGNTQAQAEKLSASFLYGVWQVLGGYPRFRQPVVRRLNLLNWSSPDGLGRFEREVAPQTDVAIVYGGMYDQASAHQGIGYLHAMYSSNRLLVIYEGCAPPDMNRDQFAGAFRRQGFKNIMGA